MTRPKKLLGTIALVFLAVAASEQVAAAESLTMDQSVQIALRRNRDVIAARLEIDAAQVERIAAGVYWNPVFSYTVNNFVLGAGNSQDKNLSPGPFSQLVHTIGLSEVVDVWAKRHARINAAELGIEYHRLRVEDALREIVFVVRGAFLDLVREQFEYQLNRDMKLRHDETLRLSRARVQAGEISPSEGQKIELEGLKYQNNLIDSELELELARQHLAALLGLAAASDLQGPAVINDGPRQPPTIAPLVTRALENRPDLRAAKKSELVADAMISAARREAYPDISVGVTYTHSEFTASGDNSNSAGLSVALPLPIFDRNQGGVGRARLEYKRSENEITRLNLMVQHEVAEAVRKVERSGSMLDVYEGGGMLNRADNALRVAESSYKAGAVSLLELLEAQRTYIETRAQYLRVQDDYRKASIEVNHAVGEKTPMKRISSHLASTIFVLSVCGAVAGCNHTPVAEAGEPAAHTAGSIKVDADKLKFIKTEVLQESDAAATVALTGRVTFDEDHTQRVSSPLDGRATALLVKPGDKVKVGQSLIELASSQVAQFQSDTQKAVQDADIAQRTVDRARKLRNDGAVSDKEMAQAEADLSKAKSEVARTSAQIGSLGISASNPGAGAALHARVAGTIVERNVLVGQEVRADAPLPLLTISNLDVVWVLADVYEQDLGLVKPGATVAVHVAAYPGESFVGTIGHLGDVVDPNSRTVKLRCVVPNPDSRLKPEMFAKVELTETNGKKVLVVPSRAVLNDSEHSRVVLSTGDSVFEMRVVQVGPEVDGKVRVLDGLKPGDRVVTEGAIFLKNELDNK